jgi:acetyl-CoA carboxylase biotin carboxyl carrier protein
MTTRERDVHSDDYPALTQAVREFAAVMQRAGLRRLEVARGDLRIVLEAGDASTASRQPEAGDPGALGPSDLQPTVADADLHTIVAPMVGTFYAAPAPDADPFVQVGDRVASGQTVAIVEAMKIMNEIVADRPGEVVAVLVTNGQPVEYGQPLIQLRTVPG